MLTKACLGCGYRGPALQPTGHGRALRCPGCGADLYSRPPRSYAELEGFVPISDEPVARYGPAGCGQSRLARARELTVRVTVIALVITPPLIVVATAGALAALWIIRR